MMRTRPTAAVEVLLGITPLYICIRKQAISSALSPSRFKELKAGDIRGHLNIEEDPNINHVIYNTKYRIPMQYKFG